MARGIGGGMNSAPSARHAAAETPTHPLNQADAERSQARLADIELGLSHPLDAPIWRSRARSRVECLEMDANLFGLVPHEERELERLKALLA